VAVVFFFQIIEYEPYNLDCLDMKATFYTSGAGAVKFNKL